MTNIKSARNIIKTKLEEIIGDKQAGVFEIAIYNSAVREYKIQKSELSDIYSRSAYQRIGEIYTVKDDTDQLKLLLKDIREDITDYNSSRYEKERNNVKKRIEPVDLSVIIKEGEIQCRQKGCKSKKCTYYQLQTRGGDEAMTTFATCVVCKKRFKF